MPIYKANGIKNGLQKYRVVVSYTDLNGNYKKLERTAYGKTEAKETESQLLASCGQKLSGDITVRELFNEYLAAQKNAVRATTYQKFIAECNRYVLCDFDNIRLSKLTVPRLQQWKNSIAERGLSHKTNQNAYKNFSALLNFAVKMGYMPQNPLTRVGNFRDNFIAEQGEKLSFYEKPQFDLFIEEIAKMKNYGYYVFFLIAFYGGLRKGEINALKWSDIEGNTIHVRRSVAQKLKGISVYETPPKNRSSIRDVTVPTVVVDALEKQKELQKRMPEFSEDLRVCGGKTILSDTALNNANIDAAKAAGLHHLRIHDFRHSHASLLIHEGINIQEVARRLGHSDIKMTLNTYAHLYPSEQDRALNILEEISHEKSTNSTKNT